MNQPQHSELFKDAFNTMMDYKPGVLDSICDISAISPRITLNDMRSLVSELDAGGVTGQTTIIIDADTANIFEQLRVDMREMEE